MFACVRDDKAEIALVPIENSQAGRVADTQRLIPDSELQIIGEYFLEVRHNLMSIPGTNINEIKRIHSHEQGIAQCRNKILKLNKEMIVAADTFRAAAIDQLEVWSKRVGVDFFYSDNKDPASVVFSSIDKAIAIQSDVIIIDTAGRLGNNEDLMNELSKIEKVIEKQNNVTLVDNLIVLDGTSGQNALSQIDRFKSRINLSGVVITKLDSTSKAGFAISASYDYDLPIKLIGIGEGINDLLPFDPEDFSKALLGLD